MTRARYTNLPKEVANDYRRRLAALRAVERRAEKKLDWLNLHEGLSIDVMDAALEDYLRARDAADDLAWEIRRADSDALMAKQDAEHAARMAKLDAEYAARMARLAEEF